MHGDVDSSKLRCRQSKLANACTYTRNKYSIKLHCKARTKLQKHLSKKLEAISKYSKYHEIKFYNTSLNWLLSYDFQRL